MTNHLSGLWFTKKKAFKPTMFIPLSVVLVLLVGGILFYRHCKKRVKYNLDEKEEAMRSRASKNDFFGKDNR